MRNLIGRVERSASRGPGKGRGPSLAQFKLPGAGHAKLVICDHTIETTQIYLEANLAMKEEILAKTTPVEGKIGRYRPDDQLLAFLKSL
jgi:hypothetical protein